mmetsp:Transcript_757/g.1698  ORF Transcript_757/g.1698 Transcript_757/m.1698 type:complete len:414 (+) Transcript_757:157-1398(+)|eukprot:CAMPEP_0201116006 /NCGR_PEP_ID=MMETSP0850-20130426/390_1 /ASSEMBLY_ACC=CAM_ASM_000622 /TAXON_ID=183588 /ORGANISM="Pseudo-nitzschia fraudulenta, Strain WWA7" /LENGTH=413 /DNA_ID=CAMNT_0047379955 /DNA_START=93 /DNA_END=1337 /DNA_ORIENTATION=+
MAAFNKAFLLKAFLLLVCVFGTAFVFADDEASPPPKADESSSSEKAEPKVDNRAKRTLAKEIPQDTFDVKSHFDWGTYYDPKNVFCGKFDCYGILGFDYESFAREKPTQKMITKRYRALSRHWHPDKSKHPDAKERFQKIARAYEVLTSFDSRKEYDALRYDQDAYYKKYGSEVVFSFAPQSDTAFVIIFVLLIINGFVYFAQFNRWKKVCDRLAKAAIEDWSASQGGSPESKELRDKAVKLLAEERKASGETPKEAKAAAIKKGGKKGSKVTNKEKKELENDALRPIVEKLAYEITDFGAGFHKPTWKDLAVLKMAVWPYHVALGTVWQVKYWIRRIQKLDLNEEEELVLTERAVGQVVWEFSSEDEKKAMVKRELWKLSNLKEWNEEREFAKLSKTEQKQYKLMKKHEKMN